MLFLQDKLYSCGLRHPTHELEVTKCEEVNTAKRVEPEVSFFFNIYVGEIGKPCGCRLVNFQVRGSESKELEIFFSQKKFRFLPWSILYYLIFHLAKH